MKKALWALDKIMSKKLAVRTREHLAQVAGAQVHASRKRTGSLLEKLARENGPHLLLGETEWREPVRPSLPYLVSAHSIITGGTGSGKTMAALLIIEAMLHAPEFAFGVLDAKGELFERTLYLISRTIEELPENE